MKRALLLMIAVALPLSVTVANADGNIHRIAMRIEMGLNQCSIGGQGQSGCVTAITLNTPPIVPNVPNGPQSCADVEEYSGIGEAMGGCSINGSSSNFGTAQATVDNTPCARWSVTIDDPASDAYFTGSGGIQFQITHARFGGTTIASAGGAVTWLTFATIDGTNIVGQSVRLALSGVSYATGSCQALMPSSGVALAMQGFGYVTSP